MSELCQSGSGTKSKILYKTVLILLAIILVDQLTKYLTTHFLPAMNTHAYGYPYGGIGVFKNFFGIEFSINHTTNTGAAWGVLGDYQIPLMIGRIFLILGLFLYLFRFNAYPSWQIPLMLIIAGATSNVIDYFVYGHVIDMFHFVLWGYDFPVFNVADAAISIGIGFLFLLSWIHPS